MNKRQQQQELNKFYAWREKVLTQIRKKGYDGEVYTTTLTFLYCDKTAPRTAAKIIIQTAETFR